MCWNVWLDGQLQLARLKQLFALLAPVVYKLLLCRRCVDCWTLLPE